MFQIAAFFAAYETRGPTAACAVTVEVWAWQQRRLRAGRPGPVTRPRRRHRQSLSERAQPIARRQLQQGQVEKECP